MKKPANPAPKNGSSTTIRVDSSVHDQLVLIRSALQEWFLSHPCPQMREQALSLTLDKTLRIVLASFVRDYRVPVQEQE